MLSKSIKAISFQNLCQIRNQLKRECEGLKSKPWLIDLEKTLVKEIRALIQSKKKKEAQALLPKVNSQLMRVSKTGTISFSKASRLVSRITTQINKI